jgi:hypothetical protein
VAGVLLASLALLAALAALGLVLFRNPLGAGVGRYNFSTPRDALFSGLEMDANHDLRAYIELHQIAEGPQIKEKLKTLEVRYEREYKGKKILFISYEEKHEKKHETAAFEKDAASGLWLRRFVSDYEVEKDDRNLAEEMRNWSANGDLGPRRGVDGREKDAGPPR